MRLVPRYTLVLAATVAATLSIIGVVRVQVVRGDLEHDMQRDHQTIGRVLEIAVADLWREGGKKSDEIRTLLRSSGNPDGARFEWSETDRRDRVEHETVGGELVSRFPVAVGGTWVGTVVARESLTHVDRIVQTQIWHTIIGILVILAICAIASYVMGAWLVGRPVGQLVEHARRIGRGELSTPIAGFSRDELGELAHELQQAAAALAASRAKTATETEARIAAVEQMRHADRLATVGKLAAGIAHELGTPLSVVGGHAQMIAGAEVTGDAALASARAIDREATRMGKMVRQLLDFARRKGPAGTTCDPAEVARRCIGLLAVMTERSRVTCDVQGPPLRAAIDEDSLQQVLTNLCVNAIQAMPDGGALVIRTSCTAGKIRIDVRDSGTGIPDEVRSHVFEPFVTTKASGDGTGLGLAVVHGIVDDHRGRIDVETGPSGTTFSLYLEEATS